MFTYLKSSAIGIVTQTAPLFGISAPSWQDRSRSLQSSGSQNGMSRHSHWLVVVQGCFQIYHCLSDGCIQTFNWFSPQNCHSYGEIAYDTPFCSTHVCQNYRKIAPSMGHFQSIFAMFATRAPWPPWPPKSAPLDAVAVRWGSCRTKRALGHPPGVGFPMSQHFERTSYPSAMRIGWYLWSVKITLKPQQIQKDYMVIWLVALKTFQWCNNRNIIFQTNQLVKNP